MNVNEKKSWASFVQLCMDLETKSPIGRKSLRRDWTSLKRLIDEEVYPHIDTKLLESLLGKKYFEFDPENNDLKAIAAFAVGLGLLKSDRFQTALAEDNWRSPLHWLAGRSGKTLGEAITPKLCEFWLVNPTDKWEKLKGSEFYDIGWTPKELGGTVRIELKASSESPGYRFQQVRDPRTHHPESGDYDALLCVGLTSKGLDFWMIPMEEVVRLIDNGWLTNQHGGNKQSLQSQTYWMVLKSKELISQLEPWHVSAENLREFSLSLF